MPSNKPVYVRLEAGRDDRESWTYAAHLLDEFGEEATFEAMQQAFLRCAEQDDTDAAAQLSALAVRIDAIRDAAATVH